MTQWEYAYMVIGKFGIEIHLATPDGVTKGEMECQNRSFKRTAEALAKMGMAGWEIVPFNFGTSGDLNPNILYPVLFFKRQME